MLRIALSLTAVAAVAGYVWYARSLSRECCAPPREPLPPRSSLEIPARHA